MGPIQATYHCLTHPFTWDARATRSEFWCFNLVLTILPTAFLAVVLLWKFDLVLEAAEAQRMARLEPGPETRAAHEAKMVELLMAWIVPFALLGVFTIYAALAGISATVRRLHDSGHSGWWYFISMVPFIGIFWYLFLLILPSSDEKNEWGPPPSGPGFERKREKAKARREAALEAYMLPRSEVDVHNTPEAIRALRLSRTPKPVA